MKFFKGLGLIGFLGLSLAIGIDYKPEYLYIAIPTIVTGVITSLLAILIHHFPLRVNTPIIGVASLILLVGSITVLILALCKSSDKWLQNKYSSAKFDFNYDSIY